MRDHVVDHLGELDLAALGFDPVIAATLAEGVRMEPGTELFGANADATEASAMLERFPASERGRLVAAARALHR